MYIYVVLYTTENSNTMKIIELLRSLMRTLFGYVGVV